MTDNSWLDSITQSLLSMYHAVLAWVPQVLAAVAVLILGWLLARLMRRLAVRLTDGVDHLWHRLGRTAGLAALSSARPPTHMIGVLVFWLVLLFFIAAAAQLLELEFVTHWLALGLGYLPVILLSVLIVALGLMLASMSHRLVESAMFSAGVAQAQLLGRVAQLTIIVLTVMLALAQLGIDVSFLAIVLGVTLAALLGAIALAFGVGARDYVANVLAAQQLRRRYFTGDLIRILDVEGRLVSITPTMVILATEAGEVSLPAVMFSRHLSTRLEAGRDEDV